MRETKFRVWSRTGEFKMLKVCELSWEVHPDGIERMHFHGILFNQKDTTNCVGSGFGALDGREDTDWVLMQYTGLKDKNSKEIYEGDIVKYDTEDGIVIASVIYEESNDEDKWISGFILKPFKTLEYEENEPNELEVIGNIYENPELLSV